LPRARLNPSDADEVLIRVAACSVGYVDALTTLGGYQIKPPLRFTPGGEISGVVAQTAARAPTDLMGARLVAQVGGGFGDYAVCAARAVARIPDAVTFEQAAVFRTNLATALHGLRDRGALAPGERRLALDASSPALSN